MEWEENNNGLDVKSFTGNGGLKGRCRVRCGKLSVDGEDCCVCGCLSSSLSWSFLLLVAYYGEQEQGPSRNQKVEQNLMTCAAQQGDWQLALDALDGPESVVGFSAVL